MERTPLGAAALGSLGWKLSVLFNPLFSLGLVCYGNQRILLFGLPMTPSATVLLCFWLDLLCFSLCHGFTPSVLFSFGYVHHQKGTCFLWSIAKAEKVLIPLLGILLIYYRSRERYLLPPIWWYCAFLCDYFEIL